MSANSISNDAENPFKSIFQSVKDRVSSPMSGVFMVSWLLINWKVPLILIYEAVPKTDKIVAIDAYIADSSDYQLLLLPLFFTTAYLFLAPLFREIYSKWLVKIDFRVSREELVLKHDLAEVESYRNTIAAINSYLKQQLEKGGKNCELNITLVEDAILSLADINSDREAHKLLRQIKSNLEASLRESKKTTNEVESFFTQYSGELPEMYKSYIVRWSKFKSKFSR